MDFNKSRVVGAIETPIWCRSFGSGRMTMMVVFFYLDDIQTTGNLLKAEVFMLLALATGL